MNEDEAYLAYLARIRREQAIVDALPADIKAIVHEFGYKAVPEIDMLRHKALKQRRARPKDRARYVAPVIRMPD